LIVLDASVVVELLLNSEVADSIRRELTARDESLIIPDLLDVEVVSAFRSLTMGERVDAHRQAQFLSSLAALPAERYAHTPLLGRTWELRHNFTAYDAVYIALAEAMDAALYTADAKLKSGHRARVVVFGRLAPSPESGTESGAGIGPAF
jgi:predicted nucleic acid-binding protein